MDADIMEIVPKTKKRNTKSYKAELRAMTKERNQAKRSVIVWAVIALLGWAGFIHAWIMMILGK